MVCKHLKSSKIRAYSMTHVLPNSLFASMIPISLDSSAMHAKVGERVRRVNDDGIVQVRESQQLRVDVVGARIIKGEIKTLLCL
jgi:hypothetical protein